MFNNCKRTLQEERVLAEEERKFLHRHQTAIEIIKIRSQVDEAKYNAMSEVTIACHCEQGERASQEEVEEEPQN